MFLFFGAITRAGGELGLLSDANHVNASRRPNGRAVRTFQRGHREYTVSVDRPDPRPAVSNSQGAFPTF